jgi:hypothetical protein
MDRELRSREFCKKFIALRLGDEQNDTPGQGNQAVGHGLSSGLSGPAMSLRFTRLIEAQSEPIKMASAPRRWSCGCKSACRSRRLDSPSRS